VSSLYSADLDLARRCAAGDEDAWEHFVRDYRPVLYRAAQALDASGAAREIADALYAELYGVRGASGEATSLFRYFHGRSSLATWLRAVLAQRYVDHLRSQRRLEPLADDEPVRSSEPDQPDPDRPRYVRLIWNALRRAVAELDARDRLRLGCYYLQDLTLAQIGRVLAEHEATVSRQLARTRRAVRDTVERDLRDQAGLTDAQIDECFASVAGDPGPLDLAQLFDPAADGKQPAAERSGRRGDREEARS